MGSVIGALFAVLVSMMAIIPFIHYEHAGAINTKIAATAGEQREIADAAQLYIQQNTAAIEAVATATAPATITVAMLQTTGNLATSITTTNPYGQSWQVQVLQPTAGTLQALVLSTGTSLIPASQGPAIAAQTGQEGGFIPYAGQNGTMSPANAVGAYGGWTVPMAGYNSPGAGHLAALLAFNNGSLQNDYLYRVAVPGNTALNTMQTSLNMGNNKITGAQSVALGTASGSAITGNTCSPNGEIASNNNNTGDLLSCVSGKWQDVNAGQVQNLTTALGPPSAAINTAATIAADNAAGCGEFNTGWCPIVFNATCSTGQTAVYDINTYYTQLLYSGYTNYSTVPNPPFWEISCVGGVFEAVDGYYQQYNNPGGG